MCDSPLVGPTFTIKKVDESICRVSVGLKHYDDSMECVADKNEFLYTHDIYSKWVNSNKVEKEAAYSFSQLEVELFLDNESIGKPFEKLATNGKCKYIKKP